MTIEKAIEILEQLIKTLPGTLRNDEKDAVKLGIEALKMTLVDRESDLCLADTLLPGEAEE